MDHGATLAPHAVSADPGAQRVRELGDERRRLEQEQEGLMQRHLVAGEVLQKIVSRSAELLGNESPVSTRKQSPQP